TWVSLFMDRDGVLDKGTMSIGGYQDLYGEDGFTNVNTAGLELGEWFLYAQVSDGGGVSGAWSPGSFFLYEHLEVEIDILPRSRRNVIPASRRGILPVEIRGSSHFDVADVDLDTLTFGPAASAKTFRRVRARVRDVDRDGVLDLMLLYRISKSAIGPGDKEACIEGELYDGTPFEGCDSIRVRKSRRWPKHHVDRDRTRLEQHREHSSRPRGGRSESAAAHGPRPAIEVRCSPFRAGSMRFPGCREGL
ncbi:MAG: hypothetical protein VCC04_06735, partial [Myxococcota bacterium]